MSNQYVAIMGDDYSGSNIMKLTLLEVTGVLSDIYLDLSDGFRALKARRYDLVMLHAGGPCYMPALPEDPDLRQIFTDSIQIDTLHREGRVRRAPGVYLPRLRRVKLDPGSWKTNLHTVPIILVSATDYSEEPWLQMCQPIDTLLKPYSPDTVQQKVCRLLDDVSCSEPT